MTLIKFTILVEGKSREYQIPMKRNLSSEHSSPSAATIYTMKAGAYHKVDGKVIDCPVVYVNAVCDFDMYDVARKAREFYNAYGIFYGANSEYMAIRFDMLIDVVERS